MLGYFTVSIVFLGVLVISRMYLEYLILMPLHKTFYGFTWAHFSFDCITLLVAFLFGALMRVALNYLALLKQKEELVSRQVATELNLLKAQVQPHFLFNTLNNIYSLSQSGSAQAPAMIASSVPRKSLPRAQSASSRRRARADASGSPGRAILSSRRSVASLVIGLRRRRGRRPCGGLAARVR